MSQSEEMENFNNSVNGDDNVPDLNNFTSFLQGLDNKLQKRSKEKILELWNDRLYGWAWNELNELKRTSGERLAGLFIACEVIMKSWGECRINLMKGEE